MIVAPTKFVAFTEVKAIDLTTPTSYRFEWDFIERVDTRIINEIDGICLVFYWGVDQTAGNYQDGIVLAIKEYWVREVWYGVKALDDKSSGFPVRSNSHNYTTFYV